jgi:hypothetical protein
VDLKKTGCKKTGSGFFLLFKKRIGSLASSLLDCKLQAEKIWSRREARNPDIFLFTVCSVRKNLQYHEILIEKTNPDISYKIAKS